MWVEHLVLHDVRNIASAEIRLSPGLNVFVGDNAQGKTSLLEAVGLLARGRSFRTEDTQRMIRRGASGLSTSGTSVAGAVRATLQVELRAGRRRLRLDGRDVGPRDYHGRLEVAVYSAERLRVVRGTPRDRRLFLDRGAAALWPAYRRALADFERVLRQRSAALQAPAGDLAVWDEGFARLGSVLRERRAAYVQRLNAALQDGYRPSDESYAVALEPAPPPPVRELAAELERRRRDERRAGRCLVGPHRDRVRLLVNDQDVAECSSGQARSLLLALTLASVDVHREETGGASVALLDDLDSELDDARAARLCGAVAARGQALITTAHPAWARGLAAPARFFNVCAGEVLPA
jgi:DNA replication and repair protein RecF